MDGPPRRVNFADGLLLTAADLADEQAYHREMRYLHNQLHGYGTVSGLEVTTTPTTVQVAAGWAIDVHGRELVVTEPLSLVVDPEPDDGAYWVRDVVIVWHETPDRPVPAGDGAAQFTRWVEQPELVLVAGGQSPAEGLTLARLTRTGTGAADVDTSVRRPLGPA